MAKTPLKTDRFASISPQDAQVLKDTSWGFRPILPPEQRQIDELAARVQSQMARGYHVSSHSLKKVAPLIKSHDFSLMGGPYQWLALVYLAREPNKQYHQIPNSTSGAQLMTFFEPDRKGENWITRWSSKRAIGMAKEVIKELPHPAFFFHQSSRLNELRPPFQCIEPICSIASDTSVEMAKFTITKFDSMLSAFPAAQEAFHYGMYLKAVSLKDAIWTNRDDIANRAEQKAIRQLAPIFTRWDKLKCTPSDLTTLSSSVLSKLQLIKDQDSTDETAFSPVHIGRMNCLDTFFSSDDALALTHMLPLCNLNTADLLNTRIPSELGQKFYAHNGAYWGTQAATFNAWRCASSLLEMGANPWQLAGDGPNGSMSGGNPFLWLSSLSIRKNEADFGLFANAFCTALVRDSYLRDPENAKGLCEKSFQEAKEHWAKRGPNHTPDKAQSACISAAESVLLNQALNEAWAQQEIERNQMPSEAPTPVRQTARL